MGNMDYILDMLIHNRFYLSNPQEFNDPFDSKTCMHIKGDESRWRNFLEEFFYNEKSMSNKEYFDIVDKIYEVMNKTNNEFLEECKTFFNEDIKKNKKKLLLRKKEFERVLCKQIIDDIMLKVRDFNFDTNNIKNLEKFLSSDSSFDFFYNNMQGYSNAFKIFKVVCFSAIHDEILLWSHYADSHRGVCFGFKVTHQEDNSKILNVDGVEKGILLREVDYNNRIYPVDLFCFLDNSELNAKFFFNKYKAWSYEKEYRALSLSESWPNEKYLSFDRSDLKEVIFGINCSEERQQTIEKIVREFYGDDVKFYKSKQHINKYKVVNELLDV